MSLWDILREQSADWSADQDAKDASDQGYLNAVHEATQPSVVRNRLRTSARARRRGGFLTNNLDLIGPEGTRYSPENLSRKGIGGANLNRQQIGIQDALPGSVSHQDDVYFNQNKKSVWLGERLTEDNPKSATMDKRGVHIKKGVAATPLADAQGAPTTWTNKRLAETMTRYGFTDPSDFYRAWANAVSLAADSWSTTHGGKLGVLRTPFDFLEQQKQLSGAGSGVGVPHTTTTTSVDNITDGTAWSVLNDAVTHALGRAPTTSELHRFIGQARNLAADHPTVSTETRTPDAKGNISVKSSQTGGLTQGDLDLAAQNMASTPEAAAYQVSSTYMDALLQAINDPISLL